MGEKNNSKEIIRVENLDVVYFRGKPNQVSALSGINLKIYPGEFVVFFGPSGCGKSTLLYAIAGLERNITGDVFVNGKNLSKFSEADFDNHRRFTAGMVFQAYHLINSLNVLSNIILPQFSTARTPQEREAKAIDLLKFFGVAEQIKKFPNELSGGQQQRVAICRSLMNDPAMILADEPTGNLDSKSAVDVMNTLLDLNEKQNKTIILVTHSPASLDYAHRVFYLKDGRIIDEKVNRPVGSRINKSSLPADVFQADLEIGGHQPDVKTVKMGTEQAEFMSRIKAKEIVLQALFNADIGSFERLEEMVAKMILRGRRNQVDFKKFLDADWEAGGFNLDKRAAKKLAAKIELMITESRPAGGTRTETAVAQVERLKSNLLAGESIKLDRQQEERLDDLLARRWLREIDDKEFYYELKKRQKIGGVGLPPGSARQISRKLEPLILEQL